MKLLYALLAAIVFVITGCESQPSGEAFKPGGAVGVFGGGMISSR